MVDYVVPGMIDSSAGALSNRNKIINGAMSISQRQGVGVGATITSAGAGVYGPDRFWTLASITSVATVFQVSTGASDFPYAMRVQRGNGQTSTPTLYAGQTIESFNCSDLSGQTITLSFYATAGANYSGGAANIEIWTGTGTDQGTSSLNNATWTSQTRIMLGSFTPTTTRTRYSFTVTVGAGINEMAIRWVWTTTGTAGAADYIDFTGIQLEKGSVTTSFEYRNYQQELAMCQRYWFQSETISFFYYAGSGQMHSQIEFPVKMRTVPTVTYYPTVADMYARTNAGYITKDGTGTVAASQVNSGIDTDASYHGSQGANCRVARTANAEL